jgi:hypothetical protein
VSCSERIDGQSFIILCIGKNDSEEVIDEVVGGWDGGSGRKDLSETVAIDDSGAVVILIEPPVECVQLAVFSRRM